MPPIGSPSAQQMPIIDAPEGDHFAASFSAYMQETAENETSKSTDRRKAVTARATRITGSLDHPILPMPPVSCLMLLSR